LLGLWEQVAVGVACEPYGGMSHLVADVFCILALCNEHRGEEVPEIVKSDARKPSGHGNRAIYKFVEVIRIDEGISAASPFAAGLKMNPSLSTASSFNPAKIWRDFSPIPTRRVWLPFVGPNAQARRLPGKCGANREDLKQAAIEEGQ